MSLNGTGVLAIWNGIAPAAEDDFLAWHVSEHMPERVALPGFNRGRRYVALDGAPKYFNFYEADSPAVFTSEIYRARLDDPTPWSRRVIAHFADTMRTVCRVAVSKGRGGGGFVDAIRLSVADADAFVAALAERAGALLAEPGIVGIHLLHGLAEASTGGSAEKALRDRPDALADWVLLVEAADAAPLTRLRAGPLGDNALTALGASGAVERGIYRLQFSLDHAEAVQERTTP
ncbi:DUF4286 family protein [Acuticoccus kandeliae]|uniref:DUF4286 family protein n=1 Tax=Acuticoccus kandeliae TaxID=2073160 RepID=UPI000D3E5057|nr:DUF4286 family protein [Acuticoccus kandeliae]